MSVAEPLNEIVAPEANVVPVVGLVIDTVGAVLGALTVTLIELVLEAPAESVALAVIVCVPLGNVAEKLAPVPI